MRGRMHVFHGAAVTSLLVFVLSLAQPFLAHAQETGESPPPKPDVAQESVGTCVEQGRTHAKDLGTGGAFTIGLVSGAVLGLIGTGIAYFAQGNPPAPSSVEYPQDTAECRIAYQDEFRREGKSKKKRSALVGGLIGTAVAVAVLVGASE